VYLALGGVQHHQHEVRCPGYGDHLLASADALRRAFNDSRQVEQLNLRPLVLRVGWLMSFPS
jgi:hypothetical protein